MYHEEEAMHHEEAAMHHEEAAMHHEEAAHSGSAGLSCFLMDGCRRIIKQKNTFM